MLIIWYNPEKLDYEIGSDSEFERLRNKSPHRDRFEVFFRFKSTNKALADRILASLKEGDTILQPH